MRNEGSDRLRQRLFEQAVKGLVWTDQAHFCACPLLNRHQPIFQILDFRIQSLIALGQRCVIVLLHLDGNPQSARLAHAAFVNPEEIVQKYQHCNQRRRQNLQT